ncbi:MAG: hypothetical protein RIT45_4279 [Pseudomonadota bacterium]
MMRFMSGHFVVIVALALVASACGDEGVKSNNNGAGSTDTGGGGGFGDVTFGDSTGNDAAGADTGTVDTAGAADTGTTDTSTTDTATADTATTDTATTDTATTDTATTDTANTDDATTDTATSDATDGGGGVEGSCVGKCGKYDGSASCQCDSSCSQYGDCCADLDTVCGCVGDDCCKDDSECDDGLACTDDSCGAGGKCQHKAKTGTCAVEANCYVKGESPQDNACLVCDPDQDDSALSAKKGTACDDGSACTTGDACNELGQCVGTPKADCCKVDGDCTSDDTCKVGTCDAQAGTCSFAPKASCCTEGVCCDLAAKSLKAQGSSCGTEPKAIEYQCDGLAAQKRQAFDGCDGQSATGCGTSAADQAWTAWSTISTCAQDQVCVLDSKDKPPVCKAQGGGTTCANAAACDDSNPCTVDTCDAGKCTNAPKAGCCVFDSECDDGNACTIDSCTGDNACTNTAKTCTAPSDCETAACDAQTGACVATVKADSCKIDGQCIPAGAKDPNDGCQICTPGESTTAWSLTSICKCTEGVCCNAESGKIQPQATKCDDAVKSTEYQCTEDGKQLQKREAFRGCTGKSNTCSTSKSNYAWGSWEKLEDCGTGTTCEVTDPTVKGACVKTGGTTACTPGSKCCTDSGTLATKGTACGTSTVKTEQKCSSADPGGKVQERTAVAGCTGASTTCSTASTNLVWSDWKDKTTCKSTEVCELTDGVAACKAVGQCDPKLTCCTTGGTYAEKGSKCGTLALDTEWQCSSASKGAKVQKRESFGGCTGGTTGCSFSDANLHWSNWQTVTTCKSTEYCSVGEDGKPGCVAPPALSCSKTDKWEAAENTASSKSLGSFKDSDPALIVLPKPILGSATDKDYFTYAITDATNTTNPRVHVEWSAPGAVMVCAYYACDKGKNGTDCEPLTCPSDTTPYQNTAVSGTMPNGCCKVAQKGTIDFSVNAAGTTNETGKAFFNLKNESPFCQEVDVKIAFGSNTNTVCDPTKTCCGPDGNYATKGTKCGTTALKTEYKCAGTNPGDDVLVRKSYAACTGSSLTCSTAVANQVWSDWEVATACKTAEICSVPDPTKAGTCIADNALVCKASDKYEGPTKTSESYDLGSFKDGQDAIVVKPNIHLGASDDKDWFKYRIADDANLNDPEVHIEWKATDKVTVCAYYQCTKGTNGTDCYPIECPAGATAFVNSAVSGQSPNGCCMTGQQGTLEFFPDAPGLFNTDETGWVYWNIKNAAPICQYAIVKLAFDGSSAACGDGVCDSGEATSCKQDCGSCAGKCGAPYDSKAACQCDSQCASIGDCCSDKPLVCGG